MVHIPFENSSPAVGPFKPLVKRQLTPIPLLIKVAPFFCFIMLASYCKGYVMPRRNITHTEGGDGELMGGIVIR